MRELVGIAQAGLLGERADDRANGVEMDGARLADRGPAVVHLEQDVDERAAFEVVLLEPLVEEVEDREELFLGSLAAAPCLGFDPTLRPELFALLEEGEHELVLRLEVPV